MDQKFEYVRNKVVMFKLDLCCWIAPLKIGILAIGYFNLFISVLCLVATASDSFSPTFKKIQEKVMEDEDPSTSTCIMAYATEEAFSVLLIVAMYRNDSRLLRYCMYYNIAVVVASLILYSIVIAAIDVLIKIVMIFSVVYQLYVILLIRSAIVMLMEKKPKTQENGDVEQAPVEEVKPSEPSPEPEVEPENHQTEAHQSTALEVVNEEVKEEV